MPNTVNESSIVEAESRIAPYIHRTPVLSSSLLNKFLNNKFYFKVESLQKIGAFKARGAMNALLVLKEQGALPREVVAVSSGNHAQGVALAASLLGVKATIVMPKTVSELKQQATKSYGANLILTESRQEADATAQEFVARGAHQIHGYADPMVIAGQGTACYEALQDIDDNIDAIFAPCGGGGLLSGTFLARNILSPDSKVIGCEPLSANDTAISRREGKIHSLNQSPNTIADGVTTLSIADITFQYLKQLDDFIEVQEEDIIYWTQWLIHLLKVNVEPSSALAMAGAHQWLSTNKLSDQNILIIISGGNIGPDKQKQIWEKNYLEILPSNKTISS